MQIEWRGEFTNTEVNVLHAAAFETELFTNDEWSWEALTERWSLGWVTARNNAGALVGFVNVLTDGFVHAWLQDVMVDPTAQRSGLGVAIVERATTAAREAGCEWLHVDFDAEHTGFYIDACGFTPSAAGLKSL